MQKNKMQSRKIGDQESFTCPWRKTKIKNVAHNEKKILFTKQ